ncbi:MAG: phosphoribosylformylglycinamidine synthase [Deltaproteobacteria bacterium RBG_13_52_11]|nr:MAG: phosphoribosylformylglycinamidine synthase [Deltaproteobacteria bacterium RBG_13_52_11]
MPHRIEVAFKQGLRDPLGEKQATRIRNDLGLAVDAVRTVECYTIDASFDRVQLELLASEAYSDPITQRWSVDRPLAQTFDWVIEVGLLPGVTDNVGRTAREALEACLTIRLKAEEKVYTSRQYLIQGRLSQAEVEKIATELLGNPLINRFEIRSQEEWDPEKGIGPLVPQVKGLIGGRVEQFDLELTDDQLLALSRDRLLALSLAEMKAIQGYLRAEEVQKKRREIGIKEQITDVELESIAQTWSEHCKHKIFQARITYIDDAGKEEVIDGLFDTYIKGSTEAIRRSLGKKDPCLSVFTDNAGVVAFNDAWSLAFKVETHNTPSALDPYGGALTGIVGVNRDPFGTGKGAKLIFNVDIFCFAPPDWEGPLPPRVLHPKRIFEGVREGVEHGGNKSGIPTVNGSIVFDRRYVGKPLVYCGTCGIMPRIIKGEPSHIKEAHPGDLIVMVGGRIGKDGIHGATFSSEELHEASPTSAVQIGDPITQKRMTDFLLIARDRGLYTAITDNGAGGLSSSVGEMAKGPGGCEIHLERAPLKYPGLDPWEILLSESQERMTVAVAPAKIAEFLELAAKMAVEATQIGHFTKSKAFHCLWHGETVAYLDMAFFHDGAPRMDLAASWKRPKNPEPDFPLPADLTLTLERMLSRLNICSKERIVRQYDHEVQGGSSIKPLVGESSDGPGDAAVIRPLLDSLKGVVVSHGICPRYSDIDTYPMMACAIDEAVRNNVAVGGDPTRMVGLDNFCWPDPVQSAKTPDGEYKLAQLVRANKALYDYTIAYQVPCISGKDSMKNDFMAGDVKISVPPTVLFSILGRIDDVRKAVTMDVKAAGDLVYCVGQTYEEMGGSEYLAMHNCIGNQVPQVRAEQAKELYHKLHGAIMKGLIASCHDCSDGGLGVALAESAFAGGFGMEMDLSKVPAEGIERDDYLLFSESQSRFVVTIHPAKQKAFLSIMKGISVGEIGRVTKEKAFIVTGLNGKKIILGDIYKLKAAWQKTLGV